MLGSYSTQNGDKIARFIYNGTCLTYNDVNDTGTYDVSAISCDFVPCNRPWYHLSLQLNENERSWTNLYEFEGTAGGQDNILYGMSLVQTVYFNNIPFIFVVKYTMSGIQHLMDIIHIPLDGAISRGLRISFSLNSFS